MQFGGLLSFVKLDDSLEGTNRPWSISTLHDNVSNHFCLGFTKVVSSLYLLVYHQYSLVNEIGPPKSEIFLLDDTN